MIVVSFVLCILTICFIGNGVSFLMNSTNDAGNFNGYQNLVGLIMDEKMSRHQLENRLNGMEQSYLEITKELQKDRNNRQQLIDENSRLNLKLKNLTADQSKLESKFDKLHSEYSILKVNFDNLTVAHQTLNEETSKCKSTQETLERDVKNLTKEQEMLSDKYHRLLEQYLSVTSQNHDTFVNKSLFTTEMNKLDRQLNDTRRNLSSDIIHNKIKIRDTGVQLGFSLKDADKTSSAAPLKFATARFNSGNMFNMSSGEFVCKRSGLYFFIATIVREPGIAESYCMLYVNNAKLHATVGHGSTNTGHATGTAAIVYHLNVGDKVYLGDCHGIDHIHWSSSFNGFLIVPDQ